MSEMVRVQKRHVWLMKTTIVILGHVLHDLPDEAWRTWRDGEDGWSILEVVGHLRDFDKIFKKRAHLMIAEESPDLGAYDHEAIAVENQYNQQPPEEVWSDFVAHRRDFVDFFKNLSPAEWQRGGNHPEREVFMMIDAVMQVGLHDTNHLEQITRIIAEHTIGEN